MSPRRLLGAAAIAGAAIYAAVMLEDVSSLWGLGAHPARMVTKAVVSLGTVFIFGRAAVAELATWRLSVSDERLEFLGPKWMARLPQWMFAPAPTVRIDAREVQALAWDGYDNIGVRLRSGQVVPIFFRSRVAASQHEAARLAILQFVERASGTPLPALPPSDVAPWVVAKPRAAA